MDCGAGAAAGQAFLHSAMHGGAADVTDFMDRGDVLMDGPQDAVYAHDGPWAAQFGELHQHHHNSAQRAHEMEAMMLEHAFAAAQHQHDAGEALHTDAGEAVHDEERTFDDAFHGDDWLGQFEHGAETEGEQWARDFSDENVMVFTVEGEPLRTVEEKTRDSQFYNMLEKIRSKELVIDDENGAVVAGPGPSAQDAAWQAEFAAAQRGQFMDNDVDSVTAGNAEEVAADAALADAWDEHADPEAMYRQAWGSDEDDEFAEQFMRAADGHETAEDWMKEYEEMQSRLQGAQDSTDYPFDPNNPYLFHDDPFSEGVELQRQGNLAEAVLAFEAACQKDLSRQEAWKVLGTTQAENEKDVLAIRALNKARELHPKDLEVHSALAVSHTNEGNHAQALRALRDWLLSHAAYEHLSSIPLHDASDEAATVHGGEDDYASQFLFVSPSEHRDCYLLFQAAAQLNPEDPQLHSHLGVLKNLSHEYDEAATHFEEAIRLCPQDAKLWNKLGATLANGNRSREALVAYDRALDINPGYVRAQYNLGVAHSNLGEHALAAKQLLRAIAMQQGGVSCGGGGNDGSGNGGGSGRSTREMWDVLRMTLNLMDRSDLVDLTWKQDLVPFLPEFGLEDLL